MENKWTEGQRVAKEEMEKRSLMIEDLEAVKKELFQTQMQKSKSEKNMLQMELERK